MATNAQQPLPLRNDEMLWPALKFGAAAGSCGFAFGATVGVLRSAPPVLFGAASAVQWTTLGFTFSATRAALLGSALSADRSQRSSLSASIIAGAAAGGLTGALRSRTNIVPGAVFFGMAGGLFDTIEHYLQTRTEQQSNAQVDNTSKPLKASQWSWLPFRSLSDEEYASILRNRIEEINVEIASLDHIIAKLERQKLDSVDLGRIGDSTDV